VIRHLLRTDVRRLRWLLALWVFVLGLDFAVLGGLAFARGFKFDMVYMLVKNLIPALELLIVLVAIPLVVQADALASTTAFWLTRPIARRDLLGTKLAFVAVCLVVPALAAEVAALVLNGVTPRQVGLASIEIVLGWLKFALPVMALAALTPTFGRFALAGVGLYVLYTIATVSLAIWDLYRSRRADFDFFAWNQTLEDSRELVTLAATIAFSLAAVAYQYLTRRTRQTAGIALTGVLVVLSISHGWTWDFVRPIATPKTPAGLSTTGLEVSLDPSARFVSNEGDRDDPRTAIRTGRHIYGRFDVTGIPADYVAEVELVESRLDFADGHAITVDRQHAAMEEASARLFAHWDPRGVRQALVNAHVLNARESAVMTPLVQPDNDTYARYARQPGRLHATVKVVVKQYQARADVPLRPGARYDTGTTRGVLTEAHCQPQDCWVIVRETRARLRLAPAGPPDETSPFGRVPFAPRPASGLYVLHNPTRAEAFLPDDLGPDVDLEFLPRRLHHTSKLPRFTSRASAGTPTGVIDAAWLTAARLVRIESRTVASLTREITEAAFVMAPAATTAEATDPRPTGKRR